MNSGETVTAVQERNAQKLRAIEQEAAQQARVFAAQAEERVGIVEMDAERRFCAARDSMAVEIERNRLQSEQALISERIAAEKAMWTQEQRHAQYVHDLEVQATGTITQLQRGSVGITHQAPPGQATSENQAPVTPAPAASSGPTVAWGEGRPLGGAGGPRNLPPRCYICSDNSDGICRRCQKPICDPHGASQRLCPRCSWNEDDEAKNKEREARERES